MEGSRADVRVTCSAGFYVRSLAHDLGIPFGVGAHLVALRRERSGRFTLADSVGLDQLAEGQQGWPASCARWPICCRIGRSWPSPTTRWRGWAMARPPSRPARRGAPLSGRLRLIDRFGHLVALAEPRAGFLHPVLVLV